MMSRHFDIMRSKLSGAIAKKLPHDKNKLPLAYDESRAIRDVKDTALEKHRLT